MTEFLLVAENVTETEDADFVLYFGENLSFIPNYADWTWSDTLRSPFTRFITATQFFVMFVLV
jgi:hypothetical protein